MMMMMMVMRTSHRKTGNMVTHMILAIQAVGWLDTEKEERIWAKNCL